MIVKGHEANVCVSRLEVITARPSGPGPAQEVKVLRAGKGSDTPEHHGIIPDWDSGSDQRDGTSCWGRMEECQSRGETPGTTRDPVTSNAS